MLEREYQALLIKKIKKLLPDCFIQKNDANYTQGILDFTVYNGNRWAMLEVKASEKSKSRPNQQYYVDMLGKMSFCSFIYPENEERVLYALQQALTS